MLKNFKSDIDQLQSKVTQLTGDDAEACYYQFLSRIMPKVVDAEACSFFIHDPVSGKVWIKAGKGVNEKQIVVPTDDSVVGRAMASRQPIIDNEMQSHDGAHKETDAATDFVTRSVLCYPIISTDGETVTGAIEFVNKTSGGFADEDLKVAADLARMMTFNVEQTYLNQDVFALAKKLMGMVSSLLSWTLGLAVALGGILLLYMAGLMIAPSMLN